MTALNNHLIGLIAVMAGGSVGAGLRHLAGIGALRLLGPGFPYGTMFVNVVGSFLMGLLVSAVLPRLPGLEWRLFLATGLLGGFTTFSSFSLDVLTLWERHATGPMLIYLFGSVLISLAAILAGLAFGRMVG